MKYMDKALSVDKVESLVHVKVIYGQGEVRSHHSVSPPHKVVQSEESKYSECRVHYVLGDM